MGVVASETRERLAARRVYLDPERNTDLWRQLQTKANRRLVGVYGGGTTHLNNGHHLHGGVANGEAMCML